MTYKRKLFSGFLVKFLLLLLICFSVINKIFSAENKIEITQQQRFTAVRFDPSYYYNMDLETDQLCQRLIQEWKQSGINAVYIKVYDPTYGAIYQTDYPLNIQTDYGNLDLLSSIITTCHKEKIQVFAWIPAFRHKQVWETHPEWRAKSRNGDDYFPDDHVFLLCTRHTGFRNWWIGFIEDLLKNYPKLDGIDIAEPIVSWRYNQACYCQECMKVYKEHNLDKPEHIREKGFSLYRSEPLTSLLLQTSRTAQENNKIVSITTINSSHGNGTLFSPQEQRFQTGFDLNGILNSPYKPDILNVELIWQQWAEIYSDTVIFSPAWTERAVKQAVLQVNDRAKVVIHPELSTFGNIGISKQQFLESIRYAWEGGAWGVDFYDTHLAEKWDIWSSIKTALDYIPVKDITIYYDPDGLNDAKQINVLLRHFNTNTTLIPLGDQFSSQGQPTADVIFYVGTEFRESLPEEFIRFISNSDKRICWINYNVNLLLEKTGSNWGFDYEELDEKNAYHIFYKETGFTKLDTSINIIQINDSLRCQVLATARSSEKEVPYAVKDNNFWYFTDLPTSFVTEGGRHIIFADLLHDIVREYHQEKHTALVRIEDVNPTSIPSSLRAIAKFLKSKHIPFSVGLTPFYLDPATNTAITLSDNPELVKALHFMVSKGAKIVLHGVTHQYRGQTTIDYEFWDGLNDEIIFHDSENYVRERIIRGLEECYNNEIYPIAWETPHYAASQLDYEIINEFFSTAYERRQTLDFLGTDQLLPFFIPGRGNKTQLIPENLGYIPLDDPSPDPMVSYAEKNLILRDGFASFFFHPFVPLNSLKAVVKKISALGYSFADIGNLDNTVVSPSLLIASGKEELTLELNDSYLKEFYINSKGKEKQSKYSKEKLTEVFQKKVNCKPGWLYIAKATLEKKHGFLYTGSTIKIHDFWHNPPLVPLNSPVNPLILVDLNEEDNTNQQSYQEAFSSVGVDYQTISIYDFFEIPPNVNLMVIPYTAGEHLTEQQSLIILNAVSRGMNVVLEKETDLSTRIGINNYGDFKQVNAVRDEYYPQVEIHWKETGLYKNFEVPIDYVTYFSEIDSNDPLIIGGEYGEGKYLYIATLFDPTTAQGYGRYPYFLDLIQREFDLWPAVKRDQVEVYFEPGDREDVSIEDLVKMWKEYGFRKIYVSGWHVYEDWTYEYDRLIELAHENAMLVYLWLELPHLSEKFWEDHPEWREITATGSEAIVDWRHLMALTDESCLQAVFGELSDMIQKYDWDGINLAELYFESPQGPEAPQFFTPLHRSVRNRFRSRYGFDPLNYFNPSSQYYWKSNSKEWNKFVQFRKDLIIELHRKCLKFLSQENQQKIYPMEIVVTSLDDVHSREMGAYTATDTRRLVALKKEIPFTLQIEDPRELWHQGPNRYQNISQAYHNLMDQDKLILDINIVPFRSYQESLAPTRQPTGLELYNYLHYASQDKNRIALYSEANIYMVDLPWISYSLGWETQENLTSEQWEVQSDNTVVLDLDPEKHHNLKVNGLLWPAYHNGRCILPSGTHTIKSINKMNNWTSILKSSTRLVDISGELQSCIMNGRGIEISYFSPTRNYIIINEKPKKIYLDGLEFIPEITKGIPGYSLKLPQGSHEVKIYTDTKGGTSRKNISILGSVLIVTLSVFAGSVLLILYTIRFRRRRRENKKV